VDPTDTVDDIIPNVHDQALPERAYSQAMELINARDENTYRASRSPGDKQIYSTLSIKDLWEGIVRQSNKR
jgi:hypothetical protein